MPKGVGYNRDSRGRFASRPGQVSRGKARLQRNKARTAETMRALSTVAGGGAAPKSTQKMAKRAEASMRVQRRAERAYRARSRGQ